MIKSSILITALLSFASLHAQKTDTSLASFDTSYTTTSSWGYIHKDYTDVDLMINDADSSIRISGDTIRVIRMLLHIIKERDELSMKQYKLVNSAVAFTNFVPDYFKMKVHNPAWPKYLQQLKLNGYNLRRK